MATGEDAPGLSARPGPASLRALAAAIVLGGASPASAAEPAVGDPAEARRGGTGEGVTDGSFAARARRHAAGYYARPWLVVASLGVGVEENDRSQWPSRDAPGEVTHKTPVAFHLAGQALWAGFVGAGVGLYASEGAPVRSDKPGLGDRVSVALALALRPLAPLAWRRGDDYASRLAAGVGLEVGASIETVRTSLDTGAGAALHVLVSVDLPLHGGGSTGGLTLRLASRLIVGASQTLAIDEATKVPQVKNPGFAAQLFAGFAYYL